MKDLTPMMAQYRALKAKNKDALLFFRLGDFYEMFFEDAEVGSRELGITLTGRDAGKGRRAPMCGVPHHSVDDYIRILVDKGYRVAICDQMEDPSLAKGLVRRDITRVITPGTYWEGADDTSSSYIAGIVAVPAGGASRGEDVGISLCDLSTGEVLVASFRSDERGRGGAPSPRAGGAREKAVDELARLLPKECVLREDAKLQDLRHVLEKSLPGVFVTAVPEEEVTPEKGEQEPALTALDLLMSYLGATQKTDLLHLREPVFYLEEGFLEIDRSTQRNLELLERLQGGKGGTLAWVLDRCSTAMGSRLLKQWIERPLKDACKIKERLDLVETVFEDSVLRENLRHSLRQVRDLERLVTKIAYGSCNARDLVAVASSLEAVPSIEALFQGQRLPLIADILSRLDSVPEAAGRIRDAIVSEPPLSVTDGYLVKDGFSPEIDDLRDLARGGKKWLLDLEAKEREKTGIKNLKVGFNKVFGYYIEVTRSNLSSVPHDYIRRQTLSTSERFVTPELKQKETAILGAEEKLFREEHRIFCEVRDSVSSYARRIQKTARAVAELDVLVSLAHAALENGYVRPEILSAGGIAIKDGRHPVLERVLPPGAFVPNDTSLNERERILVITGPNMGGKSTYCRQTALIVLMAQMGSYVPARSCSISCVDKLFARVGAYDDLVLGQSTFMVEMSEVSRILKGVTPNSLVILDEIGRGTSTFDGLAVAWAVLEHLCESGDAGAVTPGPYALVATHYRELTLLSDIKPGVANYNVSVRKKGDEVVFLRKVARGIAEGSFGIEVSAMAGLPDSVVRRAREILQGLEAEARKGARWKAGILGQVASRGIGALEELVPGQVSLFQGEAPGGPRIGENVLEILNDLSALDADTMSPLEALHRLYEWKSKLQGREGKDGDGAKMQAAATREEPEGMR